jgi:hypothetical protein
MSNFYTDVIRKDARFGSLEPVHDLALLEPVTVQEGAGHHRRHGIKLMAYETFRSKAYETFRSKPVRPSSTIRGRPNLRKSACITTG